MPRNPAEEDLHTRAARKLYDKMPDEEPRVDQKRMSQNAKYYGDKRNFKGFGDAMSASPEATEYASYFAEVADSMMQREDDGERVDENDAPVKPSKTSVGFPKDTLQKARAAARRRGKRMGLTEEQMKAIETDVLKTF